MPTDLENATRWSLLTSKAGVSAEPNISGRTYEVVLYLNGVEVASRLQVSKRGKVVSTTYRFAAGV